MSEFTASNGIKVRTDDRNRAEYDCSHGEEPHVATTSEMEALRQFFVKENDDRLGRWRDPQEPDHVVYAVTPSRISVMSEKHGTVRIYDRTDTKEQGSYLDGSARAYFDAHPEPKPWDEAGDGDVWEFTFTRDVRDLITGEMRERLLTRLFVRTTGGWRVVGRANWFLDEKRVVSSRFVWKPEVQS